MSKAEELIRKAADFIPDGGYSEKEINLAIYMFSQGYHQAEKDVIEKATEWVEETLMAHLPYQIADEFVAEFEQAMRKEE